MWQVKLPSAAYLPRHLAALHQVKSHLTKVLLNKVYLMK